MIKILKTGINVEIVDNFLSDYHFAQIKNLMISSEKFDWYYNTGINEKNDRKYQFTHCFFSLYENRRSIYLPLFDSAIQKLRVKNLIRVKANLNPKTFIKEKLGYHTDFKDLTTAVYYINSNNGGTKFKCGKFVKSIENRMVIFNSNLSHTGITCTNENSRVVVNFNYEH